MDQHNIIPLIEELTSSNGMRVVSEEQAKLEAFIIATILNVEKRPILYRDIRGALPHHISSSGIRHALNHAIQAGILVSVSWSHQRGGKTYTHDGFEAKFV